MKHIVNSTNGVDKDRAVPAAREALWDIYVQNTKICCGFFLIRFRSLT
jgi:hypothetical protein